MGPARPAKGARLPSAGASVGAPSLREWVLARAQGCWGALWAVLAEVLSERPSEAQSGLRTVPALPCATPGAVAT